MTQLVQCVPNFSEGRRPEVIEAIVAAVRETPGVRLADWSADPDHNRLVVTFVGPPGAACAAARAACAVAVTQIDLRDHQGVHPRLGALDVLPLVPLAGITLAECAAHARELGRELAALHSLPVFFYEAASDDTHSLPFVRKEAFRSLAPDLGPPTPHPSAGAVVVGAREPLIAYNVNLATADVRTARVIARELREGGGAGFVGVRALGLSLTSRHKTQVSMNVTRTQETPLLSVFTYVVRRAAELGTTVVESEVIGALPGHTAFGVLRDALQASTLSPGQVLWESWPHSGFLPASVSRLDKVQRAHGWVNAIDSRPKGTLMDTSEIKEHMEVVGSDSQHVGIVDHLDGDRLKLTHHDSQADGKHHFLPLTAVASVGEFVTLNLTAAEAEAQWVAE